MLLIFNRAYLLWLTSGFQHMHLCELLYNWFTFLMEIIETLDSLSKLSCGIACCLHVLTPALNLDHES